MTSDMSAMGGGSKQWPYPDRRVFIPGPPKDAGVAPVETLRMSPPSTDCDRYREGFPSGRRAPAREGRGAIDDSPSDGAGARLAKAAGAAAGP